jgi:hypothetical protein
MVYEAVRPQRFNLVLAGLCAALSSIGFLAAGIIPSASTRDHGAYPLTGFVIALACLAAAAEFLRRAMDRRPRLRIDAQGIWSREYSDATIPWAQILSCRVHHIRNQRIVSFDLRDPAAFPSRNPFTRATAGINRATGFGSMGINASFLTGGSEGVVVAVRHFRPDLV